VSERLAAPLLVRRALDVMFAESGADFLYIVGTHQDEVKPKDGGASCFVEPGLLKMKLQRGAEHPMVRAVRGEDARVQTILDGTLGLAHDAIFLATALDAYVRGVEKSLVLALLLEEGLPRLSLRIPAAARVSVEHADTLDVLKAAPSASVDVVFLDPMMVREKGSSGTFGALRTFAWAERVHDALLTEAVRVARRRVVLKLGMGAPLPPVARVDGALPFSRGERGKTVVYHAHDKPT
jgi:Putative SAM-dependent methyltransferase